MTNISSPFVSIFGKDVKACFDSSFWVKLEFMSSQYTCKHINLKIPHLLLNKYLLPCSNLACFGCINNYFPLKCN